MVKKHRAVKKGHQMRKIYGDRIAILLFLIFLVAVIFLIDSARSSETASEKIVEKLVASDNPTALVLSDKVDQSRLEQFASKNYEELKKELGVDYDFTLYFEDEAGNVIPVGGKYCIGSDRASVAGVNCG